MFYTMRDIHEVKDTVLTLEKQIERKGFNEGEKVGFGKGREDGIKIGKADGIKIGKADGIKIGKADGILEVAKNMKKLGFDIRDIVNSTGLSEAEIEAI